MSSDPAVSVLIATRNRRRLLEECLASVEAQTLRDFEVVLVDDGSTDGTEDLRWRVTQYVKTPGRGMGHARNAAIDSARGKYLYILDSDDLLAPDALAESVSYLELTNADMVFSELILLKGGLARGYYGTCEQTIEDVLQFKRIPDASSLMRRSSLNVRYDEGLPSAQDLDFILRYLPGKVIKKVRRPVYYYRIHNGQEGRKRVQTETALRIRSEYQSRYCAAQCTSSTRTADGREHPMIFYYGRTRSKVVQREMYQHVDILNAAGQRAFIVQDKPGYRADWFCNQTETISWHEYESIVDADRDFVVVDEQGARRFAGVALRKIVYAHASGVNEDPLFTAAGSPAERPTVVAAFVESDHLRREVEFAHPDIPTYTIPPAIDSGTHVFTELRDKHPVIAYAGGRSSIRLMAMLGSRAGLGLNECGRFRWAGLEGATEAEAKTVLREALLLVYFCSDETVPRLALDGIASGCLVAAYGPGTLKEVLPSVYVFEWGTLPRMAEHIEGIVRSFPEDIDRWSGLVRQSRDVGVKFSAEAHAAVVIGTWKQILAKLG